MTDEMKGEFSNLFFLPSVTDKKEGINQYMENVSLHPVEITQVHF